MSKRKHERPAALPCAWCGSVFTPKSYRNRFCSQGCQTNFSNKRVDQHTLGPCPTCGSMFQSRRKDKVFCSLDCYIDSDQFKRMNATNLAALNPTLGVPKICKGCGAEYPRASRALFCGKQCRRKYFADRFDRWVANPENIALPQNFDEFLARDVLSCPVDGCEWEGEHLGYHVNIVHGITAREFKKLCGFNIGSGLVGDALSRSMSDRVKLLIADGRIPVGTGFPDGVRTATRCVSLEAREHSKKVRAELPRFRDESLPCRQCGVAVQQPRCGHRMYCSTRCRSRWYEKQASETCRCAYCGGVFASNKSQSKRHAKGLPVCCSSTCRNRLNIASALAARGINAVNNK